MSFTIGSLFDGSGGFPLAAFMCGGVPVWASEIEPYPIAVTKTRFPHMKHLGSVTDVKGNEVEPVDVIAFGSPCQDLSVAGKRAGLKHTENGDDETTRSGLFMEAVRIIKEMREATGGKYPRFALWENVPGAFSSKKGEDFRVVCEELIKIVEPDAAMPAVPKNGWAYADHYCGDRWSLAYRVLDAQFWGVPQRRRRIFLVLDLGGQCAGEVLFKRNGLRGYFEESRTPWQGIAGDDERGSGTADCESKCVAVMATSAANAEMTDGTISPCLMARAGTGGNQLPLVALTTSAFPLGFRPENTRVYDEVATTICNGTRPGFCNGIIVEVPVVDGYILDDQGGSQISVRNDGKSPTLRAEMHGNIPCVMGSAYIYDARGNGDGQTSSTITGDHENRIADYSSVVIEHSCYAMQALDDYDFAPTGDVTSTLRAGASGGSCGVSVYFLKQKDYSGEVRTQYIVRRLTPTECCRLQGFPDNWEIPDTLTELSDDAYHFWLNVRNTHAEINGKAVRDYSRSQMFTWYNKLCTDSARYKLWGNGIALPTALYIMQGMADVFAAEQ